MDRFRRPVSAVTRLVFGVDRFTPLKTGDFSQNGELGPVGPGTGRCPAVPVQVDSEDRKAKQFGLFGGVVRRKVLGSRPFEASKFHPEVLCACSLFPFVCLSARFQRLLGWVVKGESGHSN